MPPPSLRDQLSVTLKSLHQGRGWTRRAQQQRCESLLRFTREADYLHVGDSPLRGFLGGAHNEIADRAALDLGGASNDGESVARDTGLQPGGSVLRAQHGAVSSTKCTPICRT